MLAFEFSNAWLLGLGALLSGLGSFIAAIAAIRKTKANAEDACDKRIHDMERAYAAGMRVEIRHDDDDQEERWSHLP